MEKVEVGLPEIYNAIKTYQAGFGEVEVYGILNAFIRSVQAGVNCMVLTQTREHNGQKFRAFVMMKDRAGRDVFPIFTDFSQMTPFKQAVEKQGKVEVGVMPLKYVLEFLIAKDLCKSIVVNPMTQKFIAPISFYKDVLSRPLTSHITMLHADITSLYTDVIVCPTDERFSGTDGVDAAVQKAGGPEFQVLMQDDEIEIADVVAVKSAGNLHSKMVFFTRGPVFAEDMKYEDLYECYFNCMNAVKDLKGTSIAFPCISAGGNGVPMEIVVEASTRAVTTWLSANADYKIDVYFCCKKSEDKEMYQKFFDGVNKPEMKK